MFATITSLQASPNATRSAPKARVWAVRLGSTGAGAYVFDVYTTDMGEARIAVENTIRFLAKDLAEMFKHGFTVHAARPGQAVSWSLISTPFASYTPAPDLAPEVGVDTVDGLLYGSFVRTNEDGSVLVLVKDEVQEHPAEALQPRCWCGNPFRLCCDELAA